MPQGLDYCLFSLILSDLLENFVLGMLSICSSLFEHWMFGDNACKLFASASYALWLVNMLSLFWLSVDRYLFITDIKYSTYKMRTKTRFVPRGKKKRREKTRVRLVFCVFVIRKICAFSSGSSVKSYCRGLCRSFTVLHRLLQKTLVDI